LHRRSVRVKAVEWSGYGGGRCRKAWAKSWRLQLP
jgi:hypothetical protein